MFIDDSTYQRGDKTYRRVLLRTSYRVDGKVRHDTIANLSSCSDAEIQALKLALQNKNHLEKLSNIEKDIQTKQGYSVGAVWVLHRLMKELGLLKALGDSRFSKLAQWLIMACVIHPGSRLAAVRLAQQHHVCDILDLEGFDENDLYAAMDNLAKNQAQIEQQLFYFRYGDKKPHFYLYDVTSSYFEGAKNELANYGYNRDQKRGKKQIVIGLMTDEEGRPVAVEVFEGNTQDPKTVTHQIEKMAQRFGVTEVTLVGDRGMIKQAQINELSEHHFHYITAITKPQIETLMKKEIIQLSLFDENIAEVIDHDVRYILHRNPVRAEEIEITRQSKLTYLQKIMDKSNLYLADHPRAKLETALRKINAKAQQLKIDSWVQVQGIDRKISIKIDGEEKKRNSQLDGCYVIKTDVSEAIIAEKIHARYKDLACVERAFRTMKTVLLEMRAIYVRKAERTRAHVFVVMLAYLLVHHLQRKWRDVELTVEEGVAELAAISSLEIQVPGHARVLTIPQPRPMAQLLLDQLEITLPKVLPKKNAVVATKKKLVSERK
jgi:transposase